MYGVSFMFRFPTPRARLRQGVSCKVSRIESALKISRRFCYEAAGVSLDQTDLQHFKIHEIRSDSQRSARRASKSDVLEHRYIDVLQLRWGQWSDIGVQSG